MSSNGVPIFAASPPGGQRTLMLWLGAGLGTMANRVFVREAHPGAQQQRWQFPDASRDLYVDDLVGMVALLANLPQDTKTDGVITGFIHWPAAIERVYQLAGVAGVGALSSALKDLELAYDPAALVEWAQRVEAQRPSLLGVEQVDADQVEMRVGPEAVGQDQPREMLVDDATLMELAERTGQPVCTLMPDSSVQPGQVREFGHRLRIHPDDLESWKRTAAANGFAIRVETMETAGGVN